MNDIKKMFDEVVENAKKDDEEPLATKWDNYF